MTEDVSTPGTLREIRRSRQWQRRLSLAVLAAACLGFALLATVTSADSAEPEGDFSTFSHLYAQHARLPCLLCHRRPTNSPEPNFSGHSPCAGCHAEQFANASSPICAICHANTQSGALKPFPRLESFTVAFDHATHMHGAARPRQG